MPETLQRQRDVAHARHLLSLAFDERRAAYSIHYALQRLQRGERGANAPVAAIAVRNLDSGRVRLFSIKAEAERAGIDLSAQPSVGRLAALEYALLYNFNDFLSRHSEALFLHWYMRDERFGFAALEERHRRTLSEVTARIYGSRSPVPATAYGFGAGLGAFPVHVPEAHRIDVARLLGTLHGIGPTRLTELADANGLAHAEAIEGVDEPEMFERGNHARLEWSSAAKAKLIADLARLAHQGSVRAPVMKPARSGLRGLRIFINYRREDTEAAANWLHELLSEAWGHDNVFIDTDDIPAGIDFVDYLRRQIDDCDVFLAMIGRRWASAADEHGRLRLANPDDFVRSELRAALARDIPVIPVLVESTPMPAQADLPTDLHPLRRRQGVELRSREFRQDVARLVARIREAVEPSHRIGRTSGGTA